jgi:hypothetical protein
MKNHWLVAAALPVLSLLGACGAGDGMDPEQAIEDVGTVQEEVSVAFNRYAVGVIPIDPRSCPVDRTVSLYTDDEDDDNESDSTGWDLPQTLRRARRHDTGRSGTNWSFCKVDGRDFHSLTKYSGKTHYFYTTLKLGIECPNGSLERSRNIYSEKDDNRSAISGPAAPNFVDDNTTTLFFCLFGPNADKMTSFPRQKVGLLGRRRLSQFRRQPRQ